MWKQKYNAGDWVKIADKMPPHMSHFEKDLVACVQYSYRDEYGGGSQKSKQYSLVIFKNGKAVNTVSWYDEELLIPMSKEAVLRYFVRTIR